MLKYQIEAKSEAGGIALANTKRIAIPFDAAAESGNQLPNPAELFLSSFAACILKNVERYSQKLHIPYKKSKITVEGWRTDIPPAMVKVNYTLTIVSDATPQKIELLHKNIKKFGTIYNTVAGSCEVNAKLIHKNEMG